VDSDGTSFDASVRTLLLLAGMSVEVAPGADFYAVEQRFGRTRRIAVECWSDGQAASPDRIEQLRIRFAPRYERNEIDEVLLVTAGGLTAEAEAVVRALRWLTHLELAKLENSVIDFRRYLGECREQFVADGLASYYIPPRVNGDQDLATLVRNWIATGTRPLAILGGYGIGKTTFARAMVAALAADVGNYPEVRIPLLVRLADMAAEQSLEGLLGRTFAVAGLVQNYTFSAFMSLNARGRFVIFLDGFDEMRHSLTWEQLRHNLAELNRLIVPNSRVVLLGQSTAFLTDEEQQYALHATRSFGDSTLRDPNWPDYEEIHMQVFSPDQMAAFAERYVSYLASIGHGGDRTASLQDALARIPHLADLARRPVQLRMLMEVLPHVSASKQVSRATIYDVFINLLLEREQEKMARRLFPVAERRYFVRKLAFWSWTEASQHAVALADIPAYLFPREVRGNDTDDVRRDLVSASFLDRAGSHAVWFPHRSIQEFLVAEAMLEEIRSRGADLAMHSRAASDDVCAFLRDLVSADDVAAFDETLSRYSGPLGRAYATAFLTTEYNERIVSGLTQRTSGKWGFVLATALAASPDAVAAETVSALLSQHLAATSELLDRFLILACLMSLTADAGSALPIVGHNLWQAIERFEGDVDLPRATMFEAVLKRIWLKIPRDLVEGDATLDVLPAFEYLLKIVAGHASLSDWNPARLPAAIPLPRNTFRRRRRAFAGHAADFLRPRPIAPTPYAPASSGS
jgi:hypothetical protein